MSEESPREQSEPDQSGFDQSEFDQSDFEHSEYERPRRPHWRKRSFWKTFLIFLVVYAIIRIGVTVALDRTNSREDSAPVEPGPAEVVPDTPEPSDG